MKNRPAFFSGLASLEHYDYYYKDLLSDGEKSQYVIGFRRKPKSSELPYQGQLIIDSESLAISSLTFELNIKELRSLKNPFVVKASRRFKVALKSTNYFVSYVTVSDRLAINYVSLETDYRVKRRKGPFSVKYKTQSELLINSYSIEDVKKITRSDAFPIGHIFLEEPIILDDSYWEGFGLIPLEQSLLKASKMLKAQ